MARKKHSAALVKNLATLNSTLNLLNRNLVGSSRINIPGHHLGSGNNFGIGNTGNLIEKAISKVLGLDQEIFRKQALIYGKSLANVTETIPNELLNKNFQNSLIAQLKILDSGLDTNNGSLLGLTTKMETLGQDSNALIGVMRTAQIFGRMSTERISELTKVVEESADTYGVSVDTITRAMSLVISDFRLGALGITDKIGAAIGNLAARFGPGTDNLFAPLIEKIIDPMIYQFSVLTGAQGDIEALLKGSFGGKDSGDQLLLIADKFASTFDKFSESMTGLPTQLRLSMADQLTGGLGLLSKTIVGLEERRKREGVKDPILSIGETLERLFNQISKIGTYLLPRLVVIAETIANYLQFIFNQFAVFVGGFKILGNLSDSLDVGIANINKHSEDWFNAINKQTQIQEEQKRIQQSEMAEKSKDRFLKSNAYLSMTADSMKSTIENIIYRGDMQRKLVSLTEEQLRILSQLVYNTGKSATVPTPNPMRQ